jgi:AcrR family transcriptional regulator
VATSDQRKDGKSRIARRRAAAKAEASEYYVARRASFLQAAAGVFKLKGVASTSIDDIARVAGVDRATLYYYVRSKEELYQDVIVDAVKTNIEMAERIADGDESAESKLRALIAGVMHSYAEHYPQMFVFMREDTSSLPTPAYAELDMVDMKRRFDRAMISIIRGGVESGTFRSDISPRLAAYGIIGMLNWTHRWFDPDGPLDADDVAKAFASLAVDGLKND